MAEKLDAIISLMETTGRMKDFFDIYYIATTYDIMGEVLQKAIQNTLINRGRIYEKKFISDLFRLTKDSDIQKRWDNFCKKILNYNLNLTDVVNIIISFTLPPYEAIFDENNFSMEWNHDKGKYC